MATIPLQVFIDEGALVKTVREMRKAGIDVKFDWDAITRPKQQATLAKPKISNGTPIAPGLLGQTVIGFLLDGPKHMRALHECAVKAGFSAKSVNSLLFQFRRQGITEFAEGRGMHRLTEMTMQQFGAGKKAPNSEIKALPAPEQKATPKSPDVLALLAEHGPISRSEIVAFLDERGLNGQRADQPLYHLRHKMKWIKKTAGGKYELTAEGRKQLKPT